MSEKKRKNPVKTNNRHAERFFAGKNGRKKRLLVKILCIVLAVLAALALLTFILGKVSEKTASVTEEKRREEKEKQQIERENSYTFYEPYPAEDILGDPEYKEKMRDITYYDGYGNGVTITDGDYLSHGGIGLQFLAYFFKSVREGDEETLNKLFSSDYLEENGKFKPFKPQRIYDIYVEFKGDEYDEESGDTTLIYTVSYKIMKNDGTFRRDIGSDMSRKQYFTVLDNGEDLYITNIVEVKRMFG